ncbi:PA3496 family putative envelope integrity protein [Legionella fairfieldensis]|uniref:PA3496 family putative envelope integrity protein n=1 Tax=Legionella fairfieldensis TaxID=45064 RepID=UPI00048C2F9D|nr:hypothetical protein [Legionella fairfieldensis]
MSDMFEDEDDLTEPHAFITTEDDIVDVDIDVDVLNEASTLDARRRLENMLEEKRLRDELDDFIDY